MDRIDMIGSYCSDRSGLGRRSNIGYHWIVRSRPSMKYKLLKNCKLNIQQGMGGKLIA